ncbi:hypothetical protein BJ085DRAFT_30387 [Dimargaris cristalligena]|uniref:Acetyl-CoA synthetase-like protein n=1 Tax=Dimargaris cristalligena TaxID=215637 RepID=A0A4Q0A2J8_9FUNG|nr:hypothetical protein BJ085DRAFT_30387 [Dimargaris cristalligena]|eukprot:RKP40356.1 hypothetical protein BJ085DRAFT_30387 [Dimargaris cristalligena]
MVFKSTLPPVTYPKTDVATFIFQSIRKSNVWSNPQQPAFINSDTGDVVTIGEFEVSANELASGWQNIVGLRPGEVVAIVSANDIHYATIIMSIILAGGIVTPANPVYTANELAHQFKDSGAKYVVVNPECLPAVEKAAQKCCISPQSVFTMPNRLSKSPVPSVFTLKSHQPFQRLSLTPEEAATQTAYLCYSSGTTAKHPAVSQFDLSSLKGILAGAAPVSPTLIGEIYQKYGIVVCQAYGMTELSPVTLVTPVNNPHQASAGILVGSMEGKIINANGEELPPNEIGELCVRGPNVMKGYLNNLQATTAMIDADGFLHTGDIGHVNEQGFIFISDRIKELIKYKGFQVAPAELEALIISHPKVLDVAVISAYDHSQATEVPKAFVVLRAQDIPATEALEKVLVEEITRFVHDNVAAHKRLRGGVEFITEVPKSAAGKILRRILRAREAEKNGSVIQTADTVMAKL